MIRVADGASALAHLLGTADSPGGRMPDLILLDLQLPDMDGFAAVTAIRSNRATHQLPVVVLSTSDRREDVHRSYEAGANAYIVKPADFEELTRSLAVSREFWGEIVQLPTRMH